MDRDVCSVLPFLNLNSIQGVLHIVKQPFDTMIEDNDLWLLIQGLICLHMMNIHDYLVDHA